jgi:hypothetical protein
MAGTGSSMVLVNGCEAWTSRDDSRLAFVDMTIQRRISVHGLLDRRDDACDISKAHEARRLTRRVRDSFIQCRSLLALRIWFVAPLLPFSLLLSS